MATCTQSSKFPQHKHLSKTSDPSVTRGPDLLSPWIRCSGLRMGRSAQAELKPGGAVGGLCLCPGAPVPPQTSGLPKSNKAQPEANFLSHELFLSSSAVSRKH